MLANNSSASSSAVPSAMSTTSDSSVPLTDAPATAAVPVVSTNNVSFNSGVAGPSRVPRDVVSQPSYDWIRRFETTVIPPPPPAPVKPVLPDHLVKVPIASLPSPYKEQMLRYLALKNVWVGRKRQHEKFKVASDLPIYLAQSTAMMKMQGIKFTPLDVTQFSLQMAKSDRQHAQRNRQMKRSLRHPSQSFDAGDLSADLQEAESQQILADNSSSQTPLSPVPTTDLQPPVIPTVNQLPPVYPMALNQPSFNPYMYPPFMFQQLQQMYQLPQSHLPGSSPTSGIVTPAPPMGATSPALSHTSLDATLLAAVDTLLQVEQPVSIGSSSTAPPQPPAEGPSSGPLVEDVPMDAYQSAATTPAP